MRGTNSRVTTVEGKAMSAQTFWTDNLLNKLILVEDKAAGTAYANAIDSDVQHIVGAAFSYQVNDYYANLKSYSFNDNNSSLLRTVEHVGIDINHLESLGAWQPLLPPY
jgi:hypothetical protein